MSQVKESNAPLSAIELLECSLCCESMFPPIYQCKEGHTVCVSCKEKVQNCHICRCDTIDIRCRALEKLAESLDQIPCKYSSHGCTEKMGYISKREHEQKCAYRPFQCLHSAQGCAFSGTIQDLVKHLIQSHHYDLLETNKIDYTCDIENYTQKYTLPNRDTISQIVWQRNIYHCNNKYYVLRINRRSETDSCFYISLLLLHSKHHSNKYTIYTENNHRKFLFQGPVWSIRKGFKEIERVRDCLIIPENIALFLSGGKGSENDLSLIKLRIQGEIAPPL